MEWLLYEAWGLFKEYSAIVIFGSAAIISIAIWVRAWWQYRQFSFVLAFAITVFIWFLATSLHLFYHNLWSIIDWLYKLIAAQVDDVDNMKISIGSSPFRNASLSIAGSITLLITALGVVLTIIRHILTRQQNDTGQQRIVGEQISRAIDQIGAYKQSPSGITHGPNIEARIGGIYSLERIAKDSDRDYTKIMDILCAYLRATTSKRTQKAIQEDIQAAIDVLGTKKDSWLLRILLVIKKVLRLLGIKKASWLLGKRDKFRVNLENCNLSGYRFSELNFNTYTDSNSGAIFDNGKFVDSEFHRTDLSYVSFDKATLTGAYFEFAILKGARFKGVNFKGVRFKRANVCGADLSEAKNLGDKQIEEMIGDKKTKLPDGKKLKRWKVWLFPI